ncbi:hypothetical protein MKX29_24020 [Cytobacillus sp. FSL R7-0696]|uniref:hypothetical protein n=1 Tax=Cytobacillus sp. FSL R7-0696 TaxID=2921691 RepID=UPI0030F4D193
MVSYITFMKHAEKVAKAASSSRPVLKGIYHAENGDAIVTDSHRLYVANNCQSAQDTSIINPKTGEKIDGSYPDVYRLLPVNDPVYTLSIDVNEALKAAKAFKALLQFPEKTINTTVTISDNKALLAVNTPVVSATYTLGEVDVSNEVPIIMFSILYFIEALDMFKDLGVSTITLNNYGQNRPFTLTNNHDLLALIMPIRTA